ncbi:uncharacterized protein [Triticum aestivum]|uniref:uncharacterized protein n=1 Tax=Triticum aestivum TaxID=4565 RepID=UPI001D009C42|nr:uncharacterized protein LOC123075116 [Triticum aestivum]
MSAATTYLAWQQMGRAREARVVVGVPHTEPLQMRREGETWVAIGVPLLEPCPRSKPSPCHKPLMRCFMIVVGIIYTVMLFMVDGPLYARILATCVIWIVPISMLMLTFESDDLLNDTT